MPRLKIAIGALLLVLWLPATSHCLIERAGIIQVTDCCDESPAGCADGNCAGPCGAVETNTIKFSDPNCNPSPPILAVLRILDKELAGPSRSPRSSAVLFPSPKQHLAEFLAARTLPVRAPSSVV